MERVEAKNTKNRYPRTFARNLTNLTERYVRSAAQFQEAAENSHGLWDVP